ncbi:organelle RRM domain-containing protein 1, chloroplastic-like [Wolffia australiana]
MELIVPRGCLPPIRLHGSVRSTSEICGSIWVARSETCRRMNRRGLQSLAASQKTDFSLPSTSSRSFCVDMEDPPADVGFSRADVVDYYVMVLARVLGDEKEAQSCIYDASWGNPYRFRCEVDEESYRVLSGLGNVLAVRPDEGIKSQSISPKFSVSSSDSSSWIVRMRKPGVEVVTRAQIVDYYSQTLAKILGNVRDAQSSIYHLSWEKDLGFCCQVDEECARRLADLQEVRSILCDENVDSIYKNYGGNDSEQSSKSSNAQDNEQSSSIKTKRLFVAGLSFYTSEKTLREAFEGFGNLVEVKIIIDTISKRSKGYAFIEYTTEEAAAMAMKEMNGKIINGWMIVVDVAKSGPSKKKGGIHQGPASSA